MPTLGLALRAAPDLAPEAGAERRRGREDHRAPDSRVMDRASTARLEAIVSENFQFTWRTLRRLVPANAVDDATQQVFVVASRKLDAITPGSERAFLFKAALWIAHYTRRTHARRREVPADDLV